MKKILIIGNSPLPDDKAKIRPAAGLRTWQFFKALKEISDFEIKMVTIAMPECYEKNSDQPESDSNKNSVHQSINKNDPLLLKKIQKIYNEFSPSIILAVNSYPSYIACSLKSSCPVWADLNGWLMAEAQAQAFKMQSNDYLPHYHNMEKTILSRADKISAVSIPQADALLGELAFLGRLNNESFGYEFVHHIPNGTEWFSDEEKNFRAEKIQDQAGGLFKNIPDDSFKLLWLGGYNTWVDEETLFKGVEKAMKKNEKLYFVSTGGKLKGLDNKTFACFLERIEKSVYKDRFKFLGWVDSGDIPYIYKMCDAGLNVDLVCTETHTGARNRINEMMKFGLPVISTLGSEISYELKKCGAGICVESGNVDELAGAILEMCGNRERGDGFLGMGEKGRLYIKEECNYKKIARPFVEWALADCARAPGEAVGVKGGKINLAVRYLKENGLRKFFNKLIQKIF